MNTELELVREDLLHLAGVGVGAGMTLKALSAIAVARDYGRATMVEDLQESLAVASERAANAEADNQKALHDLAVAAAVPADEWQLPDLAASFIADVHKLQADRDHWASGCGNQAGTIQHQQERLDALKVDLQELRDAAEALGMAMGCEPGEHDALGYCRLAAETIATRATITKASVEAIGRLHDLAGRLTVERNDLQAAVGGAWAALGEAPEAHDSLEVAITNVRTKSSNDLLAVAEALGMVTYRGDVTLERIKAVIAATGEATGWRPDGVATIHEATAAYVDMLVGERDALQAQFDAAKGQAIADEVLDAAKPIALTEAEESALWDAVIDYHNARPRGDAQRLAEAIAKVESVVLAVKRGEVSDG